MRRFATALVAVIALAGCGGHANPRRVDGATAYALTTSTGMLASAAASNADAAADRAVAAARRRLAQLRPHDATLMRARDELDAAIATLLATRRGTAARRSAATAARRVAARVERTLERYLGGGAGRLVPD
jgi:translation initiation factor 2B subunit (eIF-2B alpha/beta/delta family)